ncbi:hypothetical protein HMPREF9554_00988 [Treponema phagedenis F0421]|nr:hypothetical protein HMPREF9554_00988 [Treponema phagedenis F0421]
MIEIGLVHNFLNNNLLSVQKFDTIIYKITPPIEVFPSEIYNF